MYGMCFNFKSKHKPKNYAYVQNNDIHYSIIMKPPVISDLMDDFKRYHNEYKHYTKLMVINNNNPDRFHYYYDKVFDVMVKMIPIIDNIQKNTSLIYDWKNERFINKSVDDDNQSF